MLFENTHSDALVVSGINDGPRQDEKTSEHSKDGLTFENLDITKAYIEAKLYVVIGIRCAIDHTEYCLIFKGIPNGRKSHGIAHSITTEIGHHLTAGETMPDGNNRTMLIAVGDFVETVEGVIPSAIRLETPKYVKDFFREIPTLAASNITRFTFGLRKREVCFPGISLACGNSSGVSDMIKGRTNIGGDMTSFASKLSRYFTDEFYLMGVRSRFRVVFDNSLVRVELKKVSNPPFEIINQYACIV